MNPALKVRAWFTPTGKEESHGIPNRLYVIPTAVEGSHSTSCCA